MNAIERRGTFSLAGIYGLRMLGLFMILPVFSLYAENLEGVTPMLIGLALGVYGLTMALFQIPFGMLSDRFGRKPVIMAGLLLFAAGSVVAAMADTIWGVIAGRALQGSGAIAAAMMALLADLTSEENRTKAMAVMGASIGMSFTLALVIGPFLNNLVGVGGIFWLTAMLAFVGIAILYLLVPNPLHLHHHRDVETQTGQLRQVLGDMQLLRLDAGIMIQHGIMMAMFVALPFILRDNLGLPSSEHAWFYLPVLLISVFGMVPLIIFAEKKRLMKQVFLGCVSLIVVAQAALAFGSTTILSVGVGLLLFFIAFNTLEASLPSLISRMAPIDAKGTAMGVYSTSQFFGAGIGGPLGGIVHDQFGLHGVFIVCAVVALAWLIIASGMKVPAYLSLHMVHVDEALLHRAEELDERLLALEGVHEAKVVIEESVAYMRIDKTKFDPESANRLLTQGA